MTLLVARRVVGSFLLVTGVLLLAGLALRDLSHVSGGPWRERGVVLAPTALACLALGAVLLAG